MLLDICRHLAFHEFTNSRIMHLCIVYNTLKMACTKFRANKSAQETMDVVRIQTEINMNYLDSSFSIIRYLAWSIPSIGFIGTVFGISGALGRVDAVSYTHLTLPTKA